MCSNKTSKIKQWWIASADGYVCPEGYVNGQLGVSRAIGDFHFEGLKYKTDGAGPTKGPLTAGALPDMQSLEV